MTKSGSLEATMAEVAMAEAIEGEARAPVSPARAGVPLLTKLTGLQSGTLGELLAVAKLNILGHAAYLSPEGAPGHNLIVVINGHARSVEVKTRQFLRRATEITRWPMDMGRKGKADFFLFVELDLRSLSPTFYLLTNAQTRQAYREYGGGGNCTPSHVRRLATANDFSALTSD